MDKGARILVAGWSDLIGAGLRQALVREGYGEPLGTSNAEPDWSRREVVDAFFEATRPEYLFLAAGRSGGIQLNRTRPATLMLDNLLVNAHLLDAARRHGVRKLLYLGSSCSYPRGSDQPMRPEALLTGPLEPTNEAYALAKLAGLGLVKALRTEFGCPFITAIPANAFGPGDDFHPADAHVIGALLHRMHEAKSNALEEVVIWGTGAARREFVFVEDLAQSCLLAMQTYDGDAPLNLGSGQDLSIRELAEAIREVVGFAGALVFDATYPDGMPVKRLDSTVLESLGALSATPLRRALELTYQAYLATLGVGA